jgi:YidC/Oxa1 family membrane protein insertase
VLLGSGIGSVIHPFYVAFAWLISAFYSLIPNYAVAIALLTLTVMIVVFPITLKGTRGMMKMQLLAPEMKVLQARYKARPGASVEEKQEARQKLNEEMMALYKENNANPAGGCVPMVLQIQVFIVLYGTIRGLTHSTNGVVSPLYISHHTRLYQDIIAAHGQLRAFGINLADSVRTPGQSWPSKIPYIAMILVAIALQYIQMKQLSGRNPAAAQANPQMQQMQKIFPLFFAVIYISIPAGVNVYFIISSLFRIGQQEAMYRWDPHIQTSMHQLRARSSSQPTRSAAPAKRGGLLSGIRAAALNAGPDATAGNGNGSGNNGNGNGTRPAAKTNSANGSNNGSGATSAAKPRSGRPSGSSSASRSRSSASSSPPSPPAQPRSRDKRPRRPR